MPARLAGCTKKGPKPQGAKPSRTRSKSPSERGRRRSRSKGNQARNTGKRPRRGEETLAPGQKRARKTGAGPTGEREQERKGEERRETWRKTPTGKSRANTERDCQRAPKGLTGREAEAQAGADAPEGGVQAARSKRPPRRGPRSGGGVGDD